MSLPVRPLRVLLTVTAAALLAAACGGSSDSGTPAASGSAPAAATSAAGGDTASLPANEILTKAQAALKAAESVRLKGGGSAEGSSFQVDMKYAAGKAIGTVTAQGQTVELRRVDDVIYLKASAAFWQSSAGAQAAKTLGGKFLKAPLTDQRVAALAAFTDKDAFTKEVLDPDGTVTKGSTKEINGQQAVGLVSKGSNGGGTLWVASSGDAVPLQLVPDAGTTDSGQLDFLEYGESVDVPVPAAAETVDASKLGGS